MKLFMLLTSVISGDSEESKQNLRQKGGRVDQARESGPHVTAFWGAAKKGATLSMKQCEQRWLEFQCQVEKTAQ